MSLPGVPNESLDLYDDLPEDEPADITSTEGKVDFLPDTEHER
jgi:hypothetical protein